ncbi:MAG: hypothetical protein M3487_03505 [Actinomycetota bacterium]|nr:hypothetical protein [Actinomycetota bacterium]
MTTAALAGAASAPHAADVSPWMLVTGYDLDCQTWHEVGGTDARPAPSVATPVDLRSHVPPEHHDELEMLVGDARNAVRLRDDNGAITGAWPMGLLRRAMLEAAADSSRPTRPWPSTPPSTSCGRCWPGTGR